MSTTTTYTVEGMSCSHCVAAVTEELSKLTGVTGVNVDLDCGRVTIESEQSLDDANVVAAIDEAGYTVTT